MVKNVLETGKEILSVVIGAVVLFAFALAVGLPMKMSTLPGSRGHKAGGEDEGEEIIRPDGYIESFAGVIEEAGGGWPPALKLALPAILIWWLVYMIYNWVPRAGWP